MGKSKTAKPATVSIPVQHQPESGSGPGSAPAPGPGPGPVQTSRRQDSPRWRCPRGGGRGLFGSVVLGAGALWASSDGWDQLRSGATTLLSLAQLAGLMAGAVLLVQVVLIARIPLLERTYGQAGLVRLHRWVGVTFVTAMVVHVVLITMVHTDGDLITVLRDFTAYVAAVPVMTAAATSAALMLVVALSSRRKLRRWLGYARWHRLHTTSYLALGLAVPHTLVYGSAVRQAWARALCLLAVATAYALVLTFRVAMPLVHTRRVRPVVDRTQESAGEATSIYLRGQRADLATLAPQAGQFVNIRFLRPGQSWRAHPYSLSAAPQPNEWRLTVRDPHRHHLEIEPGTPVVLEGPYGRLTHTARAKRKVALIASGIGVTPLLALLETLPPEADPVFLYRVHNRKDAVLGAELQRIVTARAAAEGRTRPSSTALRWLEGPRGQRLDGSPSWLPKQWQREGDVVGLGNLVPLLLEREVYVCGPPQWMDAVERAALRADLPKAQLHLERFEW